MSTPFTIALLQMRYAGSPEASLKHACAMLEDAAAKGAQVACLPELFLTDYFCQRLDPEVFNLAEPADGPTNQALAGIAKKTGMVIVSSIFEKAAEGLYYNTAVVIERDGSIAGKYRKMHIPHDPLFEEKYYFAPGDLGFKAHATSAGNIGTLICWDQWYPEGARATAMLGASVLFYPTAIGWHPHEKAQYGEDQLDAWRTIQRGHAIANGVYVAAVNRVGFEGTSPDSGLEFWGTTFVADPFGKVIAQASRDREEILVVEVEPKRCEEVRRNWPFFRDRRIDAYSPILGRWRD